jgi:hypothetical protein
METAMPRTLNRVTLLSLLALGGCAGSLSKSQCLAEDWETVGFRDGIAGAQSSALLNHQNACGKHGIVPERNAYLAGWRDGVEQYCQASNGFAVGDRGGRYGNVCPPHLQGAFLTAYRDGRQLHLARAAVAEIDQAIAQRENRLQQIKSELTDIAAGLIVPGTTISDRTAMVLTAKDLAEENGELNREIESLHMERADKAARLDSLTQTLVYAN